MIEREVLEGIHAVRNKRAWCESMPRKGKYLVVDCDKNGNPIDAYHTEVLPDHLREPRERSEVVLAWMTTILIVIACFLSVSIFGDRNFPQNTFQVDPSTTIK